MNTVILHAAALLLAISTTALVLVLGHATLRSFALALAAGASIVVAMLVLDSTGRLTERADGATTPTIVGDPAGAAPGSAIRLGGIGWEVDARSVRIVVDAPGRWRARTVHVQPDADGRVDVLVPVPFADRPGCTVTAVQLTILGALRASSPCRDVRLPRAK